MNNAVFVWKENDVHALIEARVRNEQSFNGKKGSAKKNWEEIAAHLNSGATGLQCKKKWENLITKYKNIIIPPTGEGLEEMQHSAFDWPFFDALNVYMSNRHTITPILTLQSAAHPQTKRVERSASSFAHGSPQQTSYSNASNLLRPSYSRASTPSPRPVPSTTSILTRPSGSCTPTPPPRPSPSTTPTANHLQFSTTVELPLSSPGCSSWTSSSSSSISHELDAGDQIFEDSCSPVPIVNPRKRRRTQSSGNDAAIAELVAHIKAEMEESRKQQEEARKNERAMLDILKSILEKK